MIEPGIAGALLDEVVRLQSLHEALTGKGLGDTRAKRYMAAGLDRDAVWAIAALAHHAIEVNSAYARYAYRRMPTTTVSRAVRPNDLLSQVAVLELLKEAERVSQGFTRFHNSKHDSPAGPYGPAGSQAVPQVLAWTEVLALVPGPGDLSDLMTAITTRAPFWNHLFGDDLGPLVAAAGLSRAEAEARQADGSLDEDALLALAALRGMVWLTR